MKITRSGYEVGAIYNDRFVTCYDGHVINKEIFWENVRADSPEQAECRARELHAEAHPEDDLSTMTFKCYDLS